MKVEIDVDRLIDYVFKAQLDCRNCPVQSKKCPFWKGTKAEISCEEQILRYLKGE